MWEATVPVIGKIKAGTALIFDFGVTLIVLGLVIALLEGLGADELRGSTDNRLDSDEWEVTT